MNSQDLDVKPERVIRSAPNFSPASEVANATMFDEVFSARSIDPDRIPAEVIDSILLSDDVYYSSLGGKGKSVGFSYADGAIKWRSTEGKAYTDLYSRTYP